MLQESDKDDNAPLDAEEQRKLQESALRLRRRAFKGDDESLVPFPSNPSNDQIAVISCAIETLRPYCDGLGGTHVFYHDHYRMGHDGQLSNDRTWNAYAGPAIGHGVTLEDAVIACINDANDRRQLTNRIAAVERRLAHA